MDVDHSPTRTKIVKAAMRDAAVESFKIESWSVLTFVHPASKGGDLEPALAVLRDLGHEGYDVRADHSGMFVIYGPVWALPC